MELNGEYNNTFSGDAFEIILNYQNRVYEEVVQQMSGYNYQSYMSVLSGSNSDADNASDLTKNASLAAASFLNLIEEYEDEMSQLFVDATSASGENNNFIDHEVTSNGDFIVRINGQNIQI